MPDFVNPIVHGYNPFYADTYQVAAAVNEGELLELNSAGKVLQGTAGQDAIAGIALDTAGAVDDRISVYPLMPGIVFRAKASAAITKGAKVSAAAVGKVVTWTAPASPGTYTAAAMDTELQKIGDIVGIALEAAAADGDRIKVLVTR